MEYKPLDVERNEVRLLTILPSHDGKMESNEVVQVLLQHYLLDDRWRKGPLSTPRKSQSVASFEASGDVPDDRIRSKTPTSLHESADEHEDNAIIKSIESVGSANGRNIITADHEKDAIGKLEKFKSFSGSAYKILKDNDAPADKTLKIFGLLNQSLFKIDLDEIQKDTLETSNAQSAAYHGSRYTWGDYVALSYCWGDPTPTEDILVNGHVVSVGSNLEAALRRFRDMDEYQEGIMIWNDALCINQKDTTEKSREIQRMHQIYQQARDVVVWLGPNGGNNETAMKILQAVAALHPRRDMLFSSSSLKGIFSDISSVKNEYSGSWITDLRNLLRSLSKESFEALLCFFDRPYWERLWVIQELTLGNNTMPVVCGCKTVTWETIRDAAVSIMYVGFDIFYDGVTKVAGESHKVLSDPLSLLGLFQVVAIGNLDVNVNPSSVFRAEDNQKYQRQQQMSEESSGGSSIPSDTSLSTTPVNLKQRGQAPSILEIIEITQGAKCFLPSDKIYGIQNIFGMPEAARIIPNYSLSTGEVYMQYTKSFISATKSLDILSYCVGVDTGLDIPSWVPNWKERQLTFPLQNRAVLNMASKSLPALVSFTEDGRYLTCRGLLVDRIGGLGGVQSRTREIATKFGESLNNIQPSNNRLPACIKNQNDYVRASMIWKVLCAATSDTTNTMTLENLEMLRRIYNKDPPSGNGVDAWVWDFIDGCADFSVWGKPLRYYFSDKIKRPGALDHAKLKSLSSFMDTKNVREPMLWNSLIRIMKATRNRRLMISEYGYLGLAPINTRLGDLICILYGCCMPMLLRPSGANYKVIGECQLQQAMSGERLEDVVTAGSLDSKPLNVTSKSSELEEGIPRLVEKLPVFLRNVVGSKVEDHEEKDFVLC